MFKAANSAARWVTKSTCSAVWLVESTEAGRMCTECILHSFDTKNPLCSKLRTVLSGGSLRVHVAPSGWSSRQKPGASVPSA